MHEICLLGLGKPILLDYLAALGLYRALAEQRDPNATLRFDSFGVPTLETQLESEELIAWIEDGWKPSAIASPWNNGAGFSGSSKAVKCADGASRNGIELVRATTDVRLEEVRRVVDYFDQILSSGEWVKEDLVQRIRATAPDAALPWLDAALVLEGTDQSGKRRLGFPSLLGTGGNDGRFDLGNNFMIRICRTLDLQGGLLKRTKKQVVDTHAHLTHLFSGEPVTGLPRDTAGHFAPAGRGGPNGVSGSKSFDADSFGNPWAFLFGVEGTLLFAGSATRRLGSHGRARAAFPFHATRVDAGFASASPENGRDELWMPLWESAAHLAEVRRLFGEARAQVGRRRAGSGIDFARAATTLGTTRGIARFRRFSLVERAGQSNIAIHAGDFVVRESLQKAVDLLRQIDPFLSSLRRVAQGKNTPPRFGSAWHTFETAAVALTARPDGPRQRLLLRAVGRLLREVRLGLPGDSRVAKLMLRGPEWFDLAGLDDPDASALRIALSIAALRGRPGLREALLGETEPGGARAWPDAARLAPEHLLSELLSQRCRVPVQVDKQLHATSGFSYATAADLEALQRGDVDSDALRDFLWSVAASANRPTNLANNNESVPTLLPRWWIMIRLAILPEMARGASLPIPAAPHLGALVGAGEVQRALEVAARNLRAARLAPRDLRAPRRLNARQSAWAAAALLVPLGSATENSFARAVLAPEITPTQETT